MKYVINFRSIYWVFWFVTLILIIAAIAGCSACYYIVMAISFVQVLFFVIKEKSLNAFPTQIRITYFLITLLGFWEEVRLYVFILLLFGTIMVTFFDKCSISVLLSKMPWNKGKEIRLN
jgi:hypothetical protein